MAMKISPLLVSLTFAAGACGPAAEENALVQQSGETASAEQNVDSLQWNIYNWSLYTGTVTRAGCYQGTGKAVFFAWREVLDNSAYISTNRCDNGAMLDRVYVP